MNILGKRHWYIVSNGAYKEHKIFKSKSAMAEYLGIDPRSVDTLFSEMAVALVQGVMIHRVNEDDVVE